MQAQIDRIVEQVCAARAARGRLRIRGGASKLSILGASAQVHDTSVRDIVDVRSLQGIIAYEPSELVLTAAAGTTLAEIERLLADQDQELAFEAPHFGGSATLGGMLACGWSGPARPWRGAVRDAVLGVQMINGLGECLRFGGQVMKNVAGYDLARLQVGAFGRLGVVVAMSLKVLPRPRASRTQVLALARDAALRFVLDLQRTATPLSASVHIDELLYLRFSGNDAAVAAASARCGGSVLAEDAAAKIWRGLRDQQHPFFAEARDARTELWRFALPPAARYPALDGTWCTEWAGAQRWFRPAPDARLTPAGLFTAAVATGGFAQRWYPWRVVASANPVRAKLESALAHAFDPDAVFARETD